MNQHELLYYLKDTIVRELSEVPGVGYVNQYSIHNALRINLYPEKMAQYKLSVQQVLDAINNNFFVCCLLAIGIFNGKSAIGSGDRRWVIIWHIFSLFVVPVAYTVFKSPSYFEKRGRRGFQSQGDL